MKAKWFKRVGAAALVGLIVFVAIIWLIPPYDIDPETADQIRAGMTQHEVIALLKARPGWYAGPNRDYLRLRPLRADIFTNAGHVAPSGRVTKAWAGYSLMVVVGFDKEGRVEWHHSTRVIDCPNPGWGEPSFI